MKERPILFSGPMVKAILDGRKTMTRRIVKFNDKGMVCRGQHGAFIRDGIGLVWRPFGGSPEVPMPPIEVEKFSPYGVVGDRLIVRETWAHHPDGDGIIYRATDPGWDDEKTGLVWKPSIHMPHKYSRITLEITDVRVERLHEIKTGGYMFKSDVQKEGCPFENDPNLLGQDEAEWFSGLWNKINGKSHPWESNPWVWVIEFKRMTGGPK